MSCRKAKQKRKKLAQLNINQKSGEPFQARNRGRMPSGACLPQSYGRCVTPVFGTTVAFLTACCGLQGSGTTSSPIHFSHCTRARVYAAPSSRAARLRLPVIQRIGTHPLPPSSVNKNRAALKVGLDKEQNVGRALFSLPLSSRSMPHLSTQK